MIESFRSAATFLPSLPSKSLDPVTRALNIRIPDRHRASGDAYATSLVLVKFLSHLSHHHGLETAGEVLRFQNGWTKQPPRPR